jgi:hypothetical protein
MTEHAHQTDQDTQLNLDEILTRFGAEIGRISAQAMLDKLVFEAKQVAWFAEREKFQTVVARLNERIAALETPDAKGTPAADPG